MPRKRCSNKKKGPTGAMIRIGDGAQTGGATRKEWRGHGTLGLVDGNTEAGRVRKKVAEKTCVMGESKKQPDRSAQE